MDDELATYAIVNLTFLIVLHEGGHQPQPGSGLLSCNAISSASCSPSGSFGREQE